MRPLFGALLIVNGIIIGVLGICGSVTLALCLESSRSVSRFMLIPATIISIEVFIVIAVWVARYGNSKLG